MALIKSQGIIALTPTADHTSSEGFFVEYSAGSAAIVNAATDLPIGVIVDGEETTGKSSIAVGGAFHGTVHVKVTGTVAQGAFGQLTATGTCITDAGSGARVIVCRFLEAGVTGDLVEAILMVPDART